jgi:predicted permease
MWSRIAAYSSRLRLAFSRQRLAEETRVELQTHFELLVERYRRSGMAPAEAHVAAQRQLGNTLLVREEVYDMNSIGWVEAVMQDLRIALRMIRRNPGFAAAAIGTLGLGIGATAAVFSVVNGVLLRPLPYPEPDALVAVAHTAQFQQGAPNTVPLSSTMYLTYRQHNETFQSFGLWHTGAANVTGTGEPEEIRTLMVTQGTLDALGVQPALGRRFSLVDDTAGTPETVLLTDSYWRRRFGADPAIVGRTIMIDARPRDVIGVMSRSFWFMNTNADVILPQRFEAAQLQPNDMHAYAGIARLKPGVVLAQANADVARMLPFWIEEYGTNRALLTSAHFAPALKPLKQEAIGDVAQVLWLLMAAVGIVMLIVCANVGNLALVRAEGRQHELTLRAALGCTSRHIARLLLVESITLSVLGGALGLVIAYGGLWLLTTMGPKNLPRLAEVSIDPVVLAFTAMVSLLSGLFFGVIPVAKLATPSASTMLSDAMHSSGRTASQTRQRRRSQSVLVVAQVALAVVLLIASGLLVRTFQAMRHVEPGFARPEQIQTVRLTIPATQVAPERVPQMQHDIADQIAAIPGVSSVAFATSLPMEMEFKNDQPLTAEDKPYAGGMPPLRRSKFVSPGLFTTLGTPLLAGRDFTWTDLSNNQQVAVVSENLAREMWGEPSAALGKRIRLGRGGLLNEIIGVVGDVHDNGADQPAPAIVYWRGGVQRTPPGAPAYVPRAVTYAIRSSRAGTENFVRQINQAVWAVNGGLPLARVQTLSDVYEQSMLRTSFALVMLAITGSMALLLGIIGLYGVMSYMMAQRRREIGIRLALGAQLGDLRRRFVGYGLALTGIGVAIGLSGAAGLVRLMSSLLFGISPLDPVTYLAVPFVLGVAAAVVSYLLFCGRREVMRSRS